MYQKAFKLFLHTVSRSLDYDKSKSLLISLGIQHIVNGDGTIEPALNSTGQPITIYLNETEPATVSPISDRSTMTLFKRLEERDRYLSERDSSQSCGCVWLST